MKTHCDRSISPNCPGHEGTDKFGSCLAEALHYCDHDDTTGDADGFGRWVGLVIQTESETLDSDRDLPVTIPAGTYAIVSEDGCGFTSMDTYDTAEQAQAAFDDWADRYGLYLAEADRREFDIIHSTGRVYQP